jgi:NADH dehydrogenase/NADH:ubiquinone oxidoreductase subunit G
MDNITLKIDGKEVKAYETMTILQAARLSGIEIPTLCYNEKLAPYGGCRLCLVELTTNNRTRLVASCVYPAQEGLVIKTDTDRLRKIRRMLLELILPLSPTGPVLALAEKYGLKTSRFTAEQSDCVLCGLCVRYCSEIKKANAVGFTGRGIDRKAAYLPDVASNVCAACRECWTLCPSGKVVLETDGACFPKPDWEK